MNVFDIRSSSRLAKFTAHGLLNTPSPGQFSWALSVLEVNTPPGAANAAASSALAFAASAFTIRSAARACSDLATFCHPVSDPPYMTSAVPSDEPDVLESAVLAAWRLVKNPL